MTLCVWTISHSSSEISGLRSPRTSVALYSRPMASLKDGEVFLWWLLMMMRLARTP